IRRRILDNLSWGNLPYHVIEPLPPVVVPPSPPIISASVPEKPLGRPSWPAKQLVKRLITSIPILGKAAIVLMMTFLLPLSLDAGLSTRLQNLTRRIDNLSR